MTADFTSIRLEEIGPDRVRVSGVRGLPAPRNLKISAVHTDGYRAMGMMLLSGPKIRAKAAYIEKLLWSRIGRDFAESRSDLIGDRGCWLDASPDREPNEGILRIGVRDPDRKKLQHFSNTMMGFGLQGPPGLGMVGGRPNVTEAFAFWPALVPRERVTTRVEVRGGDVRGSSEIPMALEQAEDVEPPPEADPRVTALEGSDTRRVRLLDIAYGRSGDKGDNANIGIVGRSREAYTFLRSRLTAERVREHYRGLVEGGVDRYDLPNLDALNFVLRRALGGGGTLSLRVDHQGKTLAQGLLLMELDVPVEVLESVRKG